MIIKMISHSKNNLMRYDHKCVFVFIQSTRYSCQILMKLEFPHQIFEKYSSMKFHENPSSENRVVQCERMDRQRDERTDGQKRQN
jgi:hypothetical protein